MTKSPRRSITAAFGDFSAPPAAPAADAAPAGDATSPPPPAPLRPAAPGPRVGAGVIGATQRTLTEIREERDRLAALVEKGGGADGIALDPKFVDPSPFPDRLPDDGDADYVAFRQTIAEEGQKLPVQVRPHPTAPGRWQIVYGHRRWRAARDLGRALKALVVPMSDRDLVVAQGIENGNRQDLSFVERALFAMRMENAGVKARDIRAALSIDDPELARLRQVWRAVPEDVIRAIGRAPKIGRPRWVELARMLEGNPVIVEDVRKTLSADKVSGLASDQRFRLALDTASGPPPVLHEQVQKRLPLKDASGRVVARAQVSANEVRVTIEAEDAAEFAAFLSAELPFLTERYSQQRYVGAPQPRGGGSRKESD